MVGEDSDRHKGRRQVRPNRLADWHWQTSKLLRLRQLFADAPIFAPKDDGRAGLAPAAAPAVAPSMMSTQNMSPLERL